MPKQENSLDSDYTASVAGSLRFSDINRDSHIRVSLGDFVAPDEIEVDEGELNASEVESLFKQIYAVIDSPSHLKMPSEHRKDLQYIVEGLQAQIIRDYQNSKRILRRFLHFLNDRVPEISKIILNVLDKSEKH